MRKLFVHYCDVVPSSITSQDIVNYIAHVVKERGVGYETCHQIAQSCSFYYKYVYPSAFVVPSAFYARKKHKLPMIFTVEQIEQLLGVITNEKHLMMVSLFYGTGMRLDELRQMKPADIESLKFQVKVVNGKGGKERYTLLPKHLLEPLRKYYKTSCPKVYLFEGQTKGKPMHPRSIQHFLQKYITQIGLGGKDYSAHTLRHSFATHLLDNGTDIHAIKELLGHNHLSTTMIYLHLQTKKRLAICSPFDSMIQAQQALKSGSSNQTQQP